MQHSRDIVYSVPIRISIFVMINVSSEKNAPLDIKFAKNYACGTRMDHFCIHRANKRRRYNVTSALIGWVHTQDVSV